MKRVLLVVVALASVLTAGAAFSACQPPASIDATCSSDVSAPLAAWIASLGSGSTVDFAPNACYLVSTNTYATFQLAGLNSITIDGHGATLKVPAQTVGEWQPALTLIQDTNVTVKNLNIVGGFNGSNGGPGHEGQYGVVFEADNGVTLDNVNISNVQGDFMNLYIPADTKPHSTALNTGITVENSIMRNAGYHGLTLESVGCPTTSPCNGLTFQNNAVVGASLDAIDAEYDDYSTCLQNGVATEAAENYVTIKNNWWIGWNGDWYASLQAQNGPDGCNKNAPGGVAEQHLTITGNVLSGYGPFMEVEGTNQAKTAQAYTNDYWTISGNQYSSGYQAYPYRGSTTPAMYLHFVSHLTMTNNTVPVANPAMYAMDVDGIDGGLIAHNAFRDATGIVEPQSYGLYNPALTLCGNGYGPGAAQIDSTCTSAMLHGHPKHKARSHRR